MITLNVKAAILFHRAAHISGQWSPSAFYFYLSLLFFLLNHDLDLSEREFQAFAAAFQSINRLIDAFRATLPPLSDLNPKQSLTRAILLTHALTDAASIKLHTIFSYADSASKQNCVTAARDMVSFGGLNLQEIGYINPIMGVSLLKCNRYSS